MGRPAAGLKARVAELIAQHFERHAILQGQGNGGGEGIHQARNRRALLGHGDKDFARLTVLVKAHGQVALVLPHGEFMSDRLALIGQLVAIGVAARDVRLRRSLLVSGFWLTAAASFFGFASEVFSGCERLESSR